MIKIVQRTKAFNPNRLVSRCLTRIFAASEKNITVGPVFARATPAIESLLQTSSLPLVWGQVLIEGIGAGFSLKHITDETANPAELKPLKTGELRALASRNAEGEFRPLRSAPDLQRGWRCSVPGKAELEGALNELYPGSVADWLAANQSPPPVANYREFTERQSGMYRITAMLTDEQARKVIRATCHTHFCLKRRIWNIEGLEPEAASEKSNIPCLEPCAVLLETARKAMRIEQEEKVQAEIAPSDLESMLGAVEALLAGNSNLARAAEINAPLNPRRLELVLEKYRSLLRATKKGGDDA